MADTLRTAAGLASEAAATGSAMAGRFSNGMWMASGAGSMVACAVSMGTAAHDLYNKKAGAGWNMAATAAQIASGGGSAARTPPTGCVTGAVTPHIPFRDA